MESAAERKARLKALRAEAAASEGADSAADSSDSKRARKGDAADSTEPVIRFRNYKPASEDLAVETIAAPELPSIEKEVEERIAIRDEEGADVDVMNLAPRKIDWDLKRDCAKQLEKLERRTQRALATLLRERLQSEGQAADDA